jgi:general secretion pathway protein D
VARDHEILDVQRPLRAGARGLLWALALAALGSCTNLPVATEDAKTPDVFDRIRALDILPRSPQPVDNGPNGAQRAKPMIYTGSLPPSDATGAVASMGSGIGGGIGGGAGGGEGYELNFENTPITQVAKAVLGDIMGVGYSIDPRVQGSISLSSGKPVPKTDLLFVLENALRMSNVVLIRDAAGYRIVPMGDAVGGGNTDAVAGQTEPGYGVSVLPLRYVSGGALVKLLDSFAVRPGMVRADPGRNLLLIQGTGPERRTTMETALGFDVDWMRGQSVGIFPVQNSNPEPIIAELEKILDSGEGGMSQGNVKFQPMARMNGILVVTKKPDLLRAAETWIKRLDTNDTSRTGVHVYRVNYGEAKQVAKVLNDIFVGGGGSSFDTPGSTAPKSAAERLSSGGSSSGQSGLGGSSSSGSGFGSSSSSSSSSSSGRSGGSSGFQSTIGQSNSASGAGADGRSGGLAGMMGMGTGGAGGGANQPLLEGVRITADAASNSLLIYASNENYQLILRTLGQLDRPQLQVAIDATVAEVTLNDTLSYGVQFYLQNSKLGLLNTTSTSAPAAAGVSATGVATAATSFLSQTFPGFNFLVGSQSQPNVIINALHSITDVKVLSNPSLVVTDNQVATLMVGDDVPISTGSANVLTSQNTVVNTIDYRSTGIILRVVPRVSANGNVRLDIEQEISQVSNSGSTSTTQNLTPTISQRKVKSSISVATGQTVLLAGLIQEQKEQDHSGIPLLDQVPAWGNVVGNTGHNITRTELIIFIRPQVIRDSVDASYVAEELRTKLKGTLAPATPYVGPAPRAR